MGRIVCCSLFVFATFCLFISTNAGGSNEETASNGVDESLKRQRKNKPIVRDWPSDYSTSASSEELDHSSDKDWDEEDAAETEESDEFSLDVSSASDVGGDDDNDSDDTDSADDDNSDSDGSETVKSKGKMVAKPPKGKKKATEVRSRKNASLNSETEALLQKIMQMEKNKTKLGKDKKGESSRGKSATEKQRKRPKIDDILDISSNFSLSESELSTSSTENVTSKKRGKKGVINSKNDILKLKTPSKAEQQQKKKQLAGERGGEKKKQLAADQREAEKKGKRKEKLMDNLNKNKATKTEQPKKNTTKKQQQVAKTKENTQQKKPTVSGESKAMKMLSIKGDTPKSTPKRKRS